MSQGEHTQLDDHRLLGRSGLLVSPFGLGTMTFGTDWGWGADKAESRRIFDLYLDRGGNFIDTANYYTNGTSETFLGEFIEHCRDQLVIGTKYSATTIPQAPNSGGNHRKSMVRSLEASLKRLRTDYIDILWLNHWDAQTPIEEVMRALDDLVQSGKILHIGICNTPAWKIAQGNTIAQLRGWSSFIGLQAEFNVIESSAEHTLSDMAIELGLGFVAVSPLAGGLLTGKYNSLNGRSLGDRKPPDAIDQITARASLNKELGQLKPHNLAIVAEVMAIAAEIDQTPAQVALNWLLQHGDIVCCTLLGARTSQQLEENLGCLDFSLSVTHLNVLETAGQAATTALYSYLIRQTMQGSVGNATN